MTYTDELLPCPFCGASHIYVKPDEYGDGMFGVDGTHRPGCPIGNIDMCDYGEPEAAIAAWNTRTLNPDAVADVVAALESIQEYWNRDRNDAAMHNACWHAIDTAATALARIRGEG